jgi:TRAP-type mannitol/chloroaromatic compound transport system permease small subunit
MSFLRAIADFIDSINEWVGRGVAWVTLLLVLVVFVDVVMRYLFSTSFVFTQEMEWHLFSFVFLVGAGYTLLKDGHVRVDIVYQQLGPKGRAVVNLIGVIFFLIPGCYMVVETSLDFVMSSWEVLEGSPDPGGVPYRFIVKSFIPIGFGLLLIQGVSLGLRSFLVLMGGDVGEERAR